jgi:ribonuclease D
MTEEPVPHRPSSAEIAQLPPFAGLTLDRIELVQTDDQVAAAARALSGARFVGFDTETKPVFTKGVLREGPHVIQFATRERAFIVQVGEATPLEFLKDIIESKGIVKVGFGLQSDRAMLLHKLAIRLGATVDLAFALRERGFRQAVGVKAAVAIVLGRRMSKPRSATTSNWALQRLQPSQLRYAANDAYAALAVFHAMGEPYDEARDAGDRARAVPA